MQSQKQLIDLSQLMLTMGYSYDSINGVRDELKKVPGTASVLLKNIILDIKRHHTF